MLKIYNKDNSLIVEGLDNGLYPDNGQNSYPLNSLIIVTDDSDIVTFRSAATNDVLFSGVLENITINGEAVTKDNIIAKFDAVSNVESGGGMTDEEREELKNLRGDVENALGEIAELEEKSQRIPTIYKLTNFDFLGLKYNTTVTVTGHYHYDISKWTKDIIVADGKDLKDFKVGDILEDMNGIQVTMTEYNRQPNISFGFNFSGKINLQYPELTLYVKLTTGLSTSLTVTTGEFINGNTLPSDFANLNIRKITVTDFNNKQNLLKSGVNIKTINGESVLGEGNIEIESGGSYEPNIYNLDIAISSAEPTNNTVLPDIYAGHAMYLDFSNIKIGDIIKDTENTESVCFSINESYTSIVAYFLYEYLNKRRLLRLSLSKDWMTEYGSLEIRNFDQFIVGSTETQSDVFKNGTKGYKLTQTAYDELSKKSEVYSKDEINDKLSNIGTISVVNYTARAGNFSEEWNTSTSGKYEYKKVVVFPISQEQANGLLEHHYQTNTPYLLHLTTQNGNIMYVLMDTYDKDKWFDISEDIIGNNSISSYFKGQLIEDGRPCWLAVQPESSTATFYKIREKVENGGLTPEQEEKLNSIPKPQTETGVLVDGSAGYVYSTMTGNLLKSTKAVLNQPASVQNDNGVGMQFFAWGRNTSDMVYFPVATSEYNGVMSAEDKTKLDNNVLPTYNFRFSDFIYLNEKGCGYHMPYIDDMPSHPFKTTHETSFTISFNGTDGSEKRFGMGQNTEVNITNVGNDYIQELFGIDYIYAPGVWAKEVVDGEFVYWGIGMVGNNHAVIVVKESAFKKEGSTGGGSDSPFEVYNGGVRRVGSTKEIGVGSFAENESGVAGHYAHAEGDTTWAYGECAHTEGRNTTASGECAHAEGYKTRANGSWSHAEGYDNRTSNVFEHASGCYNITKNDGSFFGDSENTLFSIGNGHGSDETERHNVFDVRQNGDIYIADTSAEGEYYEKPMIKLQDALKNSGGAKLPAGNYLAKFEQNGGQIDFTQRGFDGLSESTKSITFKTVNGQSLFGMGDIQVATIDYVNQQLGNINNLLENILG